MNIKKIIKRSELYSEKKILYMAIFLYSVYFSYVSIWRHEHFLTYGFDLGIFSQIFYNTLFRGKFFYYNIELCFNPSGSYFGIHFSPFLIFLMPIFYIFPYPHTLLIIQSVAIASAAYPIYEIAYNYTSNRKISLYIALAYLFYLPNQLANLFDFHQQAFIPLFYSLIYLHFLKRDYLKMILYAMLTCLIIEFAPILIIGLSLYIYLKNRKNRKVIKYSFLMLIIALSTLIIGLAIISTINPIQTKFSFEYTFGNLGTTPAEILLNMLSKPKTLLCQTILHVAKIKYLTILLAPLLFIPLTEPIGFILLAGPWIVVALLTSVPEYYSPFFQYIFFISAQLHILTIKRLREKQVIAFAILIASVTICIILGPIGLGYMDKSTFAHTVPIKPSIDENHIKALKKAIELIPENASAIVPNHVIPHLWNRPRVYSTLIPGITGTPMVTPPIEVECNEIHILDKSVKILEITLKSDKKELSFAFSSLENETKILLEIIPGMKFFVNSGELMAIIATKSKETIFMYSMLDKKPVHTVEVEITRKNILIRTDSYETELKKGLKLIAWKVENVDYILIDTLPMYHVWRQGSLYIYAPDYGTYAVGENVLLLKRGYNGIIVNLLNGSTTVFYYKNNKKILHNTFIKKNPYLVTAIHPELLTIETGGEIVDMPEGVYPYPISKPTKLLIVKKVKMNYSVEIIQTLRIKKPGCYNITLNFSELGLLTKTTPNYEVFIDNKEINPHECVFLTAGDYTLKIIVSRNETLAILVKVSIRGKY